MCDLEIFRIRWRRWLGQKCRKDKDHWTTLLNCNWTGWVERVYFKNNIDCFIECWNRDYIKEYYGEAINMADMIDLLRLDNLYCTEKMGL